MQHGAGVKEGEAELGAEVERGQLVQAGRRMPVCRLWRSGVAAAAAAVVLGLLAILGNGVRGGSRCASVGQGRVLVLLHDCALQDFDHQAHCKALKGWGGGCA